jgi:hypothetical protein
MRKLLYLSLLCTLPLVGSAITVNCSSADSGNCVNGTTITGEPTLPIVSVNRVGFVGKKGMSLGALVPITWDYQYSIQRVSNSGYYNLAININKAVLSVTISNVNQANKQVTKLFSFSITNTGNPQSYQAALNDYKEKYLQTPNASTALAKGIAELSAEIVVESGNTTFFMYGDHNCAGVVLDSTHILTARHCVLHGISYTKESPSTFIVTTGLNWANDLNDPNNHYFVKTIYSYAEQPYSSAREFYIHGMSNQDFAVLQLEKPLTTGIKPANLDTKWLNNVKTNLSDSGYQTYAAGWGDTAPYKKGSHGGGSHFLNKGINTVVLNSEDKTPCPNAKYAEGVGFLCAGTTTEPATCSGDSGGPLFYTDENGEFHLVGIVSTIVYNQQEQKDAYFCDNISAGIFAPVYPRYLNGKAANYQTLCQWLKTAPPKGPGLTDVSGCNTTAVTTTN